MTTHTTSSGKAIPIAEMNEYHLHGAIKKMRASAVRNSMSHVDLEHLLDLEAEQARRGGPPKNAR